MSGKMKTNDENDTDDDELDIQSNKFNPLKALYSRKFKAPYEDAKVYSNMSSFMSCLSRAGNSLEADLDKASMQNKEKKKQEAETVDTDKYHVTTAGRKFLKEQAPIYRGPKAKFKRDLYVKMETVKGPIALLNKFKVNRTRVKIYVRKEHGIRGCLTGLIEAFDKHFNIVLVDCIEVWRRRKFKFSDNHVALLGQPQDCSTLLKSMGINVPEISAKSIDRKCVECTRKIPQLMIRGEDVVLVSEDKDVMSQPTDLVQVPTS